MAGKSGIFFKSKVVPMRSYRAYIAQIERQLLHYKLEAKQAKQVTIEGKLDQNPKQELQQSKRLILRSRFWIQ